MKHSLKIVIILLLMFFITQLLGLAVASIYASNSDNIPFGMAPPEGITPTTSLISIIFAIAFAVLLILLLMRFRTTFFLRIWFFVVVVLAIGITANAALINTKLSTIFVNFSFFTMNLASLIALLIALPLAFLKIFRRTIIIHNLTELLIYPGIAVIFIPLLNVWTMVCLLVLISLYDMYAVWYAGFMQKMAKYQMKNLKVFSGFFVPYIGKKEKELIQNAKNKKIKSTKLKKIKVNIALLGGGDIVFPLIFAGIVLRTFGFMPALIVVLGATAALAYLFYISKKGKFYPAMPFISAGCFLALGIVYLLRYLAVL